jgi:hypothetical protein
MKKQTLYLLATFLLVSSLHAFPRKVLYEEFTAQG